MPTAILIDFLKSLSMLHRVHKASTEHLENDWAVLWLATEFNELQLRTISFRSTTFKSKPLVPWQRRLAGQPGRNQSEGSRKKMAICALLAKPSLQATT